MSRCFPFPPPGYEKKSRAEDADLLKKEKSKEKKHKKEKKEKEKREGKEKRDKDKSDEKRRDKKDKKKDKGRDRDKKKDRDKEKEKAHALEESRPLGKITSQNGEEIVRVKHNSVHEEKHSGQFDFYVGNKIEEKHSGQLDSYLGNKISQNTFLSKETKNSKLVLEVGKRIEDSGTAKIGEKHSGQLDSYVGNKISQNTFLSKETKNSKLVPEVGKRIEDSGTAKVEKFAVAQPKRDDGMATQVARSSETWFEGKEQNKNKKIDERKFNGQGIRHEERFSGNSAVPSSTATVTATTTVESGVAGMFKQLEKSDERRKETNDKIRPKEGKSKHKDKDKEKKGRSKDKESDKEKKKEKKAKKEKEKKEKVEEKNAMIEKTKEINKDNLLGRHSTNTNTSQLPDSNIGTAVEENLIKKRKDFEPNGVLHAIDNRSSKLLRPTSHPLKENGRILEPCLTSTLPPPSEREAVANSLILVSKERKINGITEAHHPPASSKHKSGEHDDHPQPTAHHPPASSKHKSGGQDDHPQPTVIHKKSPHPDSKYLSQVYSVPEMEELADSDNQDWLFSSNISQVMKSKLGASEAEEMPQVWAEVMQIESDDVYALPYVIPY